MPAEILRTELKGYEEITLPYTIRSKIAHLQYDSKQKYQFVIFDTETTCTGKLAEMCQLSAVSENGKHEFSTYTKKQHKLECLPCQWYDHQDHKRSKDIHGKKLGDICF